jgi:hypothetical protein
LKALLTVRHLRVAATDAVNANSPERDMHAQSVRTLRTASMLRAFLRVPTLARVPVRAFSTAYDAAPTPTPAPRVLSTPSSRPRPRPDQVDERSIWLGNLPADGSATVKDVRALLAAVTDKPVLDVKLGVLPRFLHHTPPADRARTPATRLSGASARCAFVRFADSTRAAAALNDARAAASTGGLPAIHGRVPFVGPALRPAPAASSRVLFRPKDASAATSGPAVRKALGAHGAHVLHVSLSKRSACTPGPAGR